MDLLVDALGLDVRPPYATIRFSFGHDTTQDDVDRAAEALIRIAARVIALSA